MIIFPVLFIILILIGVYWLVTDSDKIYSELELFEKRAMYGPKEEIVNLRKELFDYKKGWHKFHFVKMNKIFAIIDARQRYEK